MTGCTIKLPRPQRQCNFSYGSSTVPFVSVFSHDRAYQETYFGNDDVVTSAPWTVAKNKGKNIQRLDHNGFQQQ